MYLRVFIAEGGQVFPQKDTQRSMYKQPAMCQARLWLIIRGEAPCSHVREKGQWQ